MRLPGLVSEVGEKSANQRLHYFYNRFIIMVTYHIMAITATAMHRNILLSKLYVLLSIPEPNVPIIMKIRIFKLPMMAKMGMEKVEPT